MRARTRSVGPWTRWTHCHSPEKILVGVRLVLEAKAPGLSEWSLQQGMVRSRWSEMALKSTQMSAEGVKTMSRWALEVMTMLMLAEGTQPTRPLCGIFGSWHALPWRCREVRPCLLCLNPGSMLLRIHRKVVGWLPGTRVLGRLELLGNVGLVILVLSGEQVGFAGRPGRRKVRVRAPLRGRLL